MSSFDSFSSSQDEGYQTEAVVKWFNLTKGFGFVATPDGASDAFLHSSVVSRAGLQNIAEGTKILATINDGPKGRQVLTIVQILGVGEIPQNSNNGFSGGFSNGFGGGGGRPAPTGPEVEMSGSVKWFKQDKGFGFVTPDDGDRDIFVHRSILLRAGLMGLEPGQKVRMKVQTASKGREATSIEVL